MNYKEAMRRVLNKRWKVSTCNQGQSCWCRIIEPEKKIEYEDSEELRIVSQGSIPKELAEYIVELHNEKINKERFMKLVSKRETNTVERAKQRLKNSGINQKK